MSIYLVDKLISDFDETISKKDTIRSLVHAAVENRSAGKAQILKAWQETVEWYTVRYSRICNEWLDGHHAHAGASVVDFLRAFEALEMKSIARVMEQRFLAGLRREELREMGRQVQKREGVKGCLSAMRNAGVTVEVLSANWSQTFIEGAVEGLCDSVVTNRLLFDEDGYSTGEIQLSVVSAHDKWRHFCAPQSKTGKTAYVGDSISDLRAIIGADVGILVGENQTCLRTINRFQIPMQRVTDSSNINAALQRAAAENELILHADSWETVCDLLKQP